MILVQIMLSTLGLINFGRLLFKPFLSHLESNQLGMKTYFITTSLKIYFKKLVFNLYHFEHSCHFYSSQITQFISWNQKFSLFKGRIKKFKPYR